MKYLGRWCGRGVLVWLAMTILPVHAGRVFDFEASWRWRKGTSEASLPNPAAWREPGFDDRAWGEDPAPFYYGEPLNGTLLSDMRGGYTCVYLRQSFVVKDPTALGAMRLLALSDDGFVAWINGREVVRFNVPDGEIPFNGLARQPFSEPLPTETYEIPDPASILVPGINVIAVQAFNNSLANSSDFVFQAALETDIDDVPPRMELVVPSAGSRVPELTRVLVAFTEPVTGVDAADLRIAGVPATSVTDFGADQYVFEFPAVSPGPVRIAWAADAGIRDRSPFANAFAGGAWDYIVDPNLPPPGVTLSEFMADNDRTLNDEDGEASDWIEIANTSDQSVNLAGWGLTDLAEGAPKWRFPTVSIAPRGYLVVFASGKNRTNALARLHTNFRLAREGGYLALLRPNGEVASAFTPAYPRQFEDVSYGRLANDPLATGYFATPTPGAPNAEGGPGFGPEVVFSRVGGTFLDPFPLQLSSADPTAVIRYTLDGQVPTEASPVYRVPVSIADSTRVRARAFVTGLLPGPLGAEYYVRLNPSAASATSALPYVLIHGYGGGAVPADGEYPAFLSLYEPRGGVSSLTNAPDLRARVRLNIRGSSTLGQAKRNYTVEFRDEREADLDLAPLGLPADSDWVLYAPNNFEPILIHNPFIFRLSNEIGRYAPRTRFVEVYVQTGTGTVAAANYAGIYVLMEKIKRGPDRVDVAKLEPEHLTAPTVTGGYLLKIDRLDPGDAGLYAGGQGMGWVDPKEADMQLPQRAPQRTYIRTYLDRFNSALNAANWQDQVLGWRAFVDQDSWIDHHLLNVLAFNVDALRLSAYFYKPREGRLHFGPIWDFDRALNSTDGRDANPRVWQSAVGDRGTDFFNYPWWGRLFRDPDFWQAYIDRYQELRRGAFSTNHLFALIDELTGQVRAAQPREVARWPGFTTPRGSYANEITLLKNWLVQRLSFMDTNFLAAPTFNRAGGQVEPGVRLTLSAPPGATVYYTIDGSDPRAPGGNVGPAARTYSGPIPLDGVSVVRARAMDPAHRNLTGANKPPISSSWSGVVTARFTSLPGPQPGALRLTEIHARPAPPTVAELATNPQWTRGDFEFLELANTAATAVDLGGLRFTRGVTFDFASGRIASLAPGARLVLVRNTAAFAARYGAAANAVVAGEYAGGLDAGGETLRLEDAAGRVVLEAHYRLGPYPAADGLGFSLVPRDEPAVAEQAASAGPVTGLAAWRPSTQPGGSPGSVDPAPPALPRVLVNEALTHTDPPLLDGIELFNPGTAAASIGGWHLTDERGNPFKYRLPAGTVIPPGGYLWLDEMAFNTDTNAPSSFRLDSTGDAVWLFAADAAGALLGYAHGFGFGAAPNGVSFGREIGCDGEEAFLPQLAVTPGAPNSGALEPALLITEVHYRPPDVFVGNDTWNDTALEFIELANVSAVSVPLFYALHPTNTWRLRDAVSWRFPANIVVPAGGRVLVVNFDPDANPQARARFVAAFAPPPGVPMFGPFAGSLPNDGASMELVRPDSPQVPPAPDAGFVPYVVVDRVHYEDQAPWSVAADGAGRSLQRVRLHGSGDDPRAWVAAFPTPGTLPTAGADTDGDTMPDAWEAEHCLDANDPGDALADADGDGLRNRDEYRAGTSPQDAADVLAWSAATVGDGRVRLTFRAKPGVRYVIEAGDTAAGAAWQRIGEEPPQAVERMVMVEDAASATGLRCYRLVVP